MKILDIMEPIDFLKQYYPDGKAVCATFPDGTIVIYPPGGFDTTVSSAAKSTIVRAISNMPVRIEP